MKKVFFLTLAFVALIAAPYVSAETTSDSQPAEVEDIYKQMDALHLQLIDRYLESGDITEEQAQIMKERIQNDDGQRRGGCGGYNRTVQTDETCVISGGCGGRGNTTFGNNARNGL